MTRKHDKVISFIQEEAASFISRLATKESLITVTHTSIAKDFKRSTVYVTVLPEDKEEKALDFLKRSRREFREYIKKNSDLRIIPQFDFEIDKGEKARQRIEELSQQ